VRIAKCAKRTFRSHAREKKTRLGRGDGIAVSRPAPLSPVPSAREKKTLLAYFSIHRWVQGSALPPEARNRRRFRIQLPLSASTFPVLLRTSAFAASTSASD